MTTRSTNTPIFSTTLKLLGVLALLLFFTGNVYSQNTKGDQPAGSREGRSKGSPRSSKGKKTFKPGSFKRVGGGEGYSPRGRARGGERAGRPIRPVFNVNKPQERQKAWKGDLAGRKLQNRNQNSEKYKPKVYRQTGPNVKRRVPDREGRQNVARGRPVTIPSATGTVKNVYRQKGPFVSSSRTKPRRQESRPVSNRTALARLKKLQTGDKLNTGGGGKERVKPRSVSRPFIRNKSINVWANFKRPKKKPVKAQTTDIAGRKIRGRNYETPKPGLLKAPNTYRGRITGKDRPYAGGGGFSKTATPRSRAWIGDIAGRGIRHRDRTSKKSIEGRPLVKGTPRSASRSKISTSPVQVRKPGYGALGLGSARMRRKTPARVNTSGIPVRSKGGFSFSGQGEQSTGWRKSKNRRVNTSGIPVRVKGKLSYGDQGFGFAGTRAKSRKRVDVSGIPVKRRMPGRFDDQGEGFAGNRSKKRERVNVSGIPIKRRMPGRFDDQGEGFGGSLKARRPLKGGGSVSGQLWNNRERALAPRVPKRTDLTSLPGNFRARRPEKGGGSVSGKLWNNNESALPKKPFRGANVAGFQGNLKAKPRDPTVAQKRVGHYRGSTKLGQVMPVNVDQGEEFTGFKKLPRWKRAYIQNKLAHEKSLKKQRPEKETYGVQGLQAKVKRRSYVRNKDVSENALMKLRQTRTDQNVAGLQNRVQRRAYVRNKDLSEEAMLKLKPTKTDQRVSGLQVKVQRRDYVRNKNASEDAMKKLKLTASDRAVAGLYGKVRQYRYVRNPSSDEDALKVREPGRAFARATDYQGNIKMQKYKLFEKRHGLHPDAQFVKTNKNNVREERDPVTNLKLWWARLFKKQETQPEHLKEKQKKPRYDKGEIGMWYD